MSESFSGRRVVVVGAARSGMAAARLLAARGANVTLADVRLDLPEAGSLTEQGIHVELGTHQARTFEGAELIVLSPGVPPRQPVLDRARRAHIPMIGEVELASRLLQGRIIAITGTKGKSTTTTLVGRMLQAAGLRAAVAGNIGAPLSAEVEGSTPDTIHVVEVSSFQLESTSTFHPWVAVLLNLSADHLDRHANLQEYAAAKAKIFANQGAGDWAVVNADDAPAMALAARHARAPRRLFALDEPLDEGTVLAEGWLVERHGGEEQRLLPVEEVRLIGRHLLADVAAAVTVARLAGADPAAARQAAASFTGLEHALEPVMVVAGIQFVNDSKATNVESARRAIESFEGRLVPIIGGRFKGGDLRDLRPALAGRSSAVIAIGEARPVVRQALGDMLAVVEADTMAEAVRAGLAAAPPGGTVLLAPACASFDMFRDYAERGRVFKREVARLAEELGGGS